MTQPVLAPDRMYAKYIACVDQVVTSGSLGSFKRHNDYMQILEHVSPPYGIQYLKCIRRDTKLTNDQIREFAAKNDSHGDPFTFKFDVGIMSPSNLRYLYHAHLILTHFKSKTSGPLDIIEVGGGYGGLCLAIDMLAPLYNVSIASYSIVDIEEVTRLQSMYLARHTLRFPVEVHASSTYGASITKPNPVLISCYCFSELSEGHRAKYVELLFPKVSTGFFAWNFVEPYDIGKKTTIVVEEPRTGPKNYYVTF